MPTDNQLARQLLVHRLDQGPSDPWHDVATGQMSALEAGRRMAAVEPPELIAASQRLFAPPEPEAHDRLRERVVERFGGGGTSVPVERRSGWWTPVFAMVAAVLLTWWLRADGVEHTSPAFVGEYRLEFLRTWEPMRDADAEPPDARKPHTYRSDSSIVLRLRPRDAVNGSIGAVVFARDDEGRAVRLGLETHDLGDGVLELEGRSLAALGLGPGWWKLEIAVGPAGSLPASVPEFEVSASNFEIVIGIIRVVAADEPR